MVSPRSGGLQRWLEARWYQGAPVPFWLTGLSRLYGALAARRAARAHRQRQRLPVPVLVVGNLSVGGTGKTPVVIALVEALRQRGFRPGVISRGYGGQERGPAQVGADGDPARYGDEPVLIAWRSEVPVVVGRDRPAAGRHLLAAHPEVDVVISDDGLQHHRLARDLEIVVIDGERRHGNGRLLPAGPLREPLVRLDEVDVVLINGRRGSDETGFDLRPGPAWPLAGGAPRTLADFASDGPVHAVAGIGEPRRFFATLRAAGVAIVEHAFADHHRYRAEELAFGDDRPVLMTEKDAIKCRNFARPNWYALPVEAELPEPALTAITRCLRASADAGTRACD